MNGCDNLERIRFSEYTCSVWRVDTTLLIEILLSAKYCSDERCWTKKTRPNDPLPKNHTISDTAVRDEWTGLSGILYLALLNWTLVSNLSFRVLKISIFQEKGNNWFCVLSKTASCSCSPVTYFNVLRDSRGAIFSCWYCNENVCRCLLPKIRCGAHSTDRKFRWPAGR